MYKKKHVKSIGKRYYMCYIYIHVTCGGSMVLEFLNALTQAGYRIFSVNDARVVIEDLGLNMSSAHYLLAALLAKKAIRQLFKGHYAIEDHLLAGVPLHKFEIAMHLAKTGSISCWSAMSYYELSDQVLSKVYILVPYAADKKRPKYCYHIDGYEYVIIPISKNNFWGTKRIFIEENKITITDLERTLLDGLIRPSYCGGFREVLNAFLIAKDNIDIKKITEYSRLSPIAVQKRLGWVLTQISIENLDEKLKIGKTQFFSKLDPSGPRRGKLNKKWMVMENF